jgi:hypothetical protein
LIRMTVAALEETSAEEMSLLRSIGSFVLVLLLAFGLVAAAAVLLVIIYGASVLIPRYIIGDGVDQFRGEKREMARFLHEETEDFSEDALFVSAYRIESVKK